MASKNEIAQSGEWSAFHAERLRSNYPRWPNEPMLKALLGGYSTQPPRPQAGARVLDVGCGFGNNLLPFADRGCECHGVEIDPSICAVAREHLAERGYKAELQVGSNRSLPYQDGWFDLVLSVATIHYEGSREQVRAGLREFRRVLRPGGALYIATVGPQHDMRRRAKALGESRYRVQDYDFRDGQVFFFFDDEADLSRHCSEFFGTVENGRVTENLFGHCVEHLIALCR